MRADDTSRCAGTHRGRTRREAGFTLLETLTALMISGVLITVVITALIGNSAINQTSEIRSQAAIAAQRSIDSIRAQDPSTLPKTGSDPVSTITIQGRDYKAKLSYCATTTYCTGTQRQILAEISYDSKLIYSVETVFTSVGSGNTSTGGGL